MLTHSFACLNRGPPNAALGWLRVCWLLSHRKAFFDTVAILWLSDQEPLCTHSMHAQCGAVYILAGRHPLSLGCPKYSFHYDHGRINIQANSILCSHRLLATACPALPLSSTTWAPSWSSQAARLTSHRLVMCASMWVGDLVPL